ncbi:MAG: PAS domain-containing protein [Alphaproteobacteria bacterium]|nr:PAS domain-containing protein [Alphaproteobacteria bacterium]
MQSLGLLLEQAPDPKAGYHRNETEIPRPAHPLSHTLLRLWRKHHGSVVVGRDLPSRGTERLLPYLALFEYRDHRCDFLVRLAGFALHRRFGRDIAHHYLADLLLQPELNNTRESLMDVLDTGIPQYRDVKIRNGSGPVLHHETILLRAWSADRRKQLVVGGYFFFDGTRKVNHPVLC